MNLNRDDVEVIQHQDRNPSGDIVHSTTIKAKVAVDGDDRLFVLLSDTFIPVGETIGDTGTIGGQFIDELWKKIIKDVKKELPDKSPEEREKIAHDILYTIQGTRRRTTQVFHGGEGIYRQIKSSGSYFS